MSYRLNEIALFLFNSKNIFGVDFSKKQKMLQVRFSLEIKTNTKMNFKNEK
jgi:hypothetical protein